MITSKAKILCVDDDHDLLIINTSILRQAGYNVIEVSTGKECLRIVKEERPDLVLLDVMLPDINGLEICRQIKEDPELCNTYIILISGIKISSENQIEGLELGADSYLVRPISGPELIARVQAMLRLKDAETALRKSKEQYQLLVETMNEGLAVVNENGIITYVNKRLCEMVGLSRNEVNGRYVTDFLDEENQKIAEEHFLEQKRGLCTPFELAWKKKDGQIVYAIISPKIIIDDKGNFKGSFAVVTDITERKMMEVLLKEKVKEIRKLNEELEQRVIERTKQLQAVIEELEGEIIDRKQAEEALKESEERFRAIITERKVDEATLLQYAERLHSLSSRLVEVQEDERRNIAQILHDEIVKSLATLKQNLENIASLGIEDIRESVDKSSGLVKELISKVRDMSLDLHPSILDEKGLLSSLLWHFDRYTKRTRIRINFIHNGLDVRFRPEIEIAAYRIVQEALANVARYATIDEVMVLILANQDKLIINIEDKRAGFDPYNLERTVYTACIKWMRERLALIGGQLMIDSTPGGGMRLKAKIPLN
jgi:PAS domain S-box-containing protein